MLRFALVGAGEHALKSHAPALALYAERNENAVELTSVCDVKYEKALKFCEKFEFVSGYSNINEMLKKEKIDACICTVPVPLILETASLLLSEGIPTLIEKPLGIHLDQSNELAKIAQISGTKNMVSANRRFTPLFTQAIDCSSKLGDIKYIRGLMARPNRKEAEFFWGTGVHIIDAMYRIAGPVNHFKVDKIMPKDKFGKWAHIDFVFEQNCRGALDILPTCGVNMETYELYGEGFHVCLQIKDFFKELVMRCWYENKLQYENYVGAEEAFYIKDGSYAELEEFINALNQNRSPKPNIEDFLSSTEIAFSVANEIA